MVLGVPMTGSLRLVTLAAAGMVLAVALTGAAVYALSERLLQQTVTVPADTIVVPTDRTSIQHGQHLASAVGLCLECHGANMAGKIDLDDPTLGRVVAPN